MPEALLRRLTGAARSRGVQSQRADSEAPLEAAQQGGGHIETIRRAYRIAVRDLRACYNPTGIVAGRLHFNAYWARDGFWALFGALVLGDYDQARAHLDTFIRYQLPSGRLPVRIEFVGHTFGGYHTWRAHPKALYRAGSMFVDPLDPAALFVVAAREYFLHTRDMSFCDRFNPVVDRATHWLMQRDRDGDGVIENRYLADWMDSILKKDKVFNINVISYEGLRACATMKEALGRGEEAEWLSADVLRVITEGRFGEAGTAPIQQLGDSLPCYR